MAEKRKDLGTAMQIFIYLTIIALKSITFSGSLKVNKSNDDIQQLSRSCFFVLRVCISQKDRTN